MRKEQGAVSVRNKDVWVEVDVSFFLVKMVKFILF